MNEKKKVIDQKIADITGIILSYNSEKTLASCLLALKKQTPELEEIIVIDDGSTDKSLEIAIESGARVISNSSNRGRGYSRNLGIKESKSEFILFCDSSNIIPSDFSSKALSHFHNEKISAVFGRILNDNRIQSTCNRWRARHLFREHLDYRTEVHDVDCLITYALMLKKSAVLTAGNFRKDLRMCEDIDLGKKLIKKGFRILSDPDLCCFSIRQENVISLCIRYHRWFSYEKEIYDPYKTFVNTFKTSLTVCSREDIRAKDFRALLISIVMPFIILLLGKLYPEKFR